MFENENRRIKDEVPAYLKAESQVKLGPEDLDKVEG